MRIVSPRAGDDISPLDKLARIACGEEASLEDCLKLLQEKTRHIIDRARPKGDLDLQRAARLGRELARDAVEMTSPPAPPLLVQMQETAADCLAALGGVRRSEPDPLAVDKAQQAVSALREAMDEADPVDRVKLGSLEYSLGTETVGRALPLTPVEARANVRGILLDHMAAMDITSVRDFTLMNLIDDTVTMLEGEIPAA